MQPCRKVRIIRENRDLGIRRHMRYIPEDGSENGLIAEVLEAIVTVD
jgi:hypothetical protein